MHSAGATRAPETPTSLSMGAQAFIATGRLTAKAAPRRAAAAAMRATPSRLPAPRPATTSTRAALKLVAGRRGLEAHVLKGVVQGRRRRALVAEHARAGPLVSSRPAPHPARPASSHEASSTRHQGAARRAKRAARWPE